jgi:phasin family protein
MIAKIEDIARQFRAEAGERADFVLESIRKATVNTAEFIASGKTPIRKIADTGIKLNRVSHKGVEKLVRNQASMIEKTLDDGAARLRLAARADSFRALVGDQIATLPASRERTVGSARKSLDIVVDTGNEIGGIVRGAIVELRPSQPAVKRVARQATATRKKVAKKTRATSKTVEKKARSASKTVEKKARAAAKPARKKVSATRAKARTAGKRAADKVSQLKVA